MGMKPRRNKKSTVVYLRNGFIERTGLWLQCYKNDKVDGVMRTYESNPFGEQTRDDVRDGC